jgi:hypothetical protein
MFQEILTYSILVFVIYLLISKGVHFFKKPSSHCESCFAAKNGCKVAELKKSVKPQKVTEFQIVTTRKLT